MYTVKEVEIADLKKIVSVHENSFKDFFLTSLGTRFLASYYKVLILSKKSFIIGFYEDDHKLLGFCAVARESKKFNSRIVKENLPVFLPLVFKLFFTKPLSLIRLVKNLSKSKPANIDAYNYAEVLSIAVSPSLQGKGAGKQMLNFTESILKNEMIHEISLTTDFYNNEKAINFYKKNGYSILYEFDTYPNRKMYRLNKNLT